MARGHPPRPGAAPARRSPDEAPSPIPRATKASRSSGTNRKVPLYAFGHGADQIEDAAEFSWPYSDAFARLTRNHYRVVSLAPIAPGRRYREVSGLYPWERVAHRREWRWLEPEAKLEIPPGEGRSRSSSSSRPIRRTRARRSSSSPTASRWRPRPSSAAAVATACVPMPAAGGLLTLRSSESFVPAEHGRARFTPARRPAPRSAAPARSRRRPFAAAALHRARSALHDGEHDETGDSPSVARTTMLVGRRGGKTDATVLA